MTRSEIEELIYGRTDKQRRFTLDFPILPDVWVAYAEEPNKPIQLLLTPHTRSDTAMLARALRKHGIPNIEVFEWLSKSRKGQPCDVYMTNRHLEDSGEDLTPGLDKFLSDEHKNEPLHNYHFRQEDALSIVVQLLDTAAFSQCRLQRTRRDSYG